MRIAISPRLAIRIFLNMADGSWLMAHGRRLMVNGGATIFHMPSAISHSP
jgi:hypothetical protein